MEQGLRQLEVELKFPLDHPEAMRKRLIGLGFKSGGEVFERNIVFDTPEGTLAGREMLLRLRSDRRTRLTFKEPPADKTYAGRFKVKQESELTVADFETMRYILNRLGFTHERLYEKYREHFSTGENISVEIDRLPHLGFILELEAPPDQMGRLALDLGLDPARGSRKNYFQLFEEFCHERGLKLEHMLFKDEKQEG